MLYFSQSLLKITRTARAIIFKQKMFVHKKLKILLYHWLVFHFRIGWNKQKSNSVLVCDNSYTKYFNGAHGPFCKVKRVMATHFELISLPYLPNPDTLCYMFIFCTTTCPER